MRTEEAFVDRLNAVCRSYGWSPAIVPMLWNRGHKDKQNVNELKLSLTFNNGYLVTWTRQRRGCKNRKRRVRKRRNRCVELELTSDRS